jgi:hypothetical protein
MECKAMGDKTAVLRISVLISDDADTFVIKFVARVNPWKNCQAAKIGRYGLHICAVKE